MKHPILAVFFTALFVGCHSADKHDRAAGTAGSGEHGHAEGEIVFSARQAQAAGLRTETVRPSAFSEVFKAAGRIEAPVGGETTVAATAAGIVRFTAAVRAEGSGVGRGAVVAYVSSRDLPDGDPVDRLRVAYTTAREAYERGRQLVADKIISQSQFEALRSDYESARLAYEAQAGSHTPSGIAVRSSGSGYVKQLLVKPGDYVAVGQPLLTLTTVRRLQLRVDVSERYLDRLATLRSARFLTPYDGRVYSLDELGGRLVSRGRATGGSPYVPVTFEFDNRGSLVAGTAVEVWLLGSERQGVVSVPRSALTEEQGLYYIYIKEGADVYRKQEVVTAGDDGRRVAIASGLKGGEEVVTAGAYEVKLAALSGALPEGHSHEH